MRHKVNLILSFDQIERIVATFISELKNSLRNKATKEP